MTPSETEKEEFLIENTYPVSSKDLWEALSRRAWVSPGIIVPATLAVLLISYGSTYAAVTNVGTRPTVNNGSDVTVEAWLLDFDGDLYGQTVRLEFLRHIRDEVRFDSLDALKAQISRDADSARQFFAEASGAAM